MAIKDLLRRQIPGFRVTDDGVVFDGSGPNFVVDYEVDEATQRSAPRLVCLRLSTG